jgi:hypothetical protein
MSKRIWVCPVNDGEAVEVRNLLQDNGEEVLVSSQPWGATWANLETQITERLRAFGQENPDGIIYGVELAGRNSFNAVNIDHHKYSDEDRSNPLASLEQVAQILGVATLTRHQQLVVLNDKGYIPAMESFGATKGEILVVRHQDQAAQGVTPDDVAQAVRDLQQADKRDRKVAVKCQKFNSAYADLSYYDYDELLVQAPDKWIYHGRRNQLFTSQGFQEAHWSGGSGSHAYFGIIQPSATTQERILELFWEE